MRALAAIVALAVSAAPAGAAGPTEDDWLRPDLPVAPTAAQRDTPSGLYYVTETYVGDAVTRDGPVTRYATITEHRSTGSYARVLTYVGTGIASRYDGRSFNGRARLADGRLVAGTYYETFVPHGTGFRPISIVFFQDDAEIARQRRDAPAPAPSGVGPASPARHAPAHAQVRAGVALARDGVTLERFEILRGRAFALWPRALVDGAPASILRWRFLSGEVVALGPAGGGAGTPFLARSDRLARPGGAWTLRFSVLVALPDGGTRSVEARIDAAVRSPALVD